VSRGIFDTALSNPVTFGGVNAVTISNRLREPSEHRPVSFSFRILAIDGGGIRGVIPATVLERFEALLAEALARYRGDPAQADVVARWDGFDPPRIADCFHLIAGTSTGALLAAGLTTTGPGPRPRLTAADCASVYQSHGAAIFHRPFARDVADHFELFYPKYPLEQLRTAISDPSVLGDGLLKDARTNVLILAFDAAAPGLRFFTNWGTPGAGGTASEPTETMVDAALASAAAPTYFDPEQLGTSRLVDGGMYAGNPALAAISMALRRTEDPVPRVPSDLFMISLGTGAWTAPLDYGSGGIIGWMQPRDGGEALLEALLGGSGDFANEAAHVLLNGSPQPSYDPNLPQATISGGPQLWRYQPTLPQPWAMDDVGKLPELKRIALEMVTYYQAELEQLAGRLIQAGPVPS
jgi:predicted acylesterase/phospholipase RssA